MEQFKKQTSPNKFTKYRQKQLLKILERFDGRKIPFYYFSDENLIKLNENKEVFPVIFACICGILIETPNNLVLIKNIKLGEEDIERDYYLK